METNKKEQIENIINKLNVLSGSQFETISNRINILINHSIQKRKKLYYRIIIKPIKTVLSVGIGILRLTFMFISGVLSLLSSFFETIEDKLEIFIIKLED